MIKKFEGFLNFIKKTPSSNSWVKKTNTPHIEDIIECLYDITDESRIYCDLNNTLDLLDYSTVIGHRNLFTPDEIVFKKELNRTDSDFDSYVNDILIHNNKLYKNYNLKIRYNSFSFRFIYDSTKISDSNINTILKHCYDKLKIYKCDITFFVRDPDTWEKSAFKKAAFKKVVYQTQNGNFNEIVSKLNGGLKERYVTIKITSKTGFDFYI